LDDKGHGYFGLTSILSSTWHQESSFSKKDAWLACGLQMFLVGALMSGHTFGSEWQMQDKEHVLIK
jgi:hypothetical protein